MKRVFTTFFAIFLALNLMAVNVWDGTSEPWIHGDGTEGNPYLIETAANLAYLAEKVNEGYQAQGMEVFRYTYFLLTDDLDLNNINWTPIGNVDMNMQGYYFAGVFDGWYHNIDHLKIQSNADVCGLFSGLSGEWDGTLSDSYGQIKHLSVTNGNVVSTGTGAGGIVGGVAGNAMVVQCSFSGTVTVNNSGSYCGAGGIAAIAAENAIIQECSFSGSVNATNTNFMAAAGAGGIVGVALNHAKICYCYNLGSIAANATMLSVAAGILGATLQENDVELESCYNIGTVNAATKGGIFGMISPINPFKGENAINVQNCYYLNTCGGNTNYGTSMASGEMQTEDFKDQLDQSTHSFVMDNGTNNGYPIHGLAAYKVWEASEVTYHSAIISADIHVGNHQFSEAKFFYYDIEDGAINEMYSVEIDIEDHVELYLEDLVPETEYGFMLSLKYADGITTVGSPHYFITEEYDAVGSENAPELLVYPNPTTGVAHIQGVEAAEISVFNAMGQLVQTVLGRNEVNLSGVAQGLYLLKITDASNNMIFKKLEVTE